MRILALAALLALAGCDAAEGPYLPRVGVLLGAEASAVRLDPATGSAAVSLVLRNEGRDVRYVPACGEQPSVVVERRRGAGWEQHGSSFCIAILPMVPLALRPGEERRFTYAIREAGEYRARTETYAAPDGRGARGVEGNGFRVE